MDLTKILARIHGLLKDRGLTAAGVSMDATGSPDTIRNWERRVKKVDKNPGASIVTLGPIADTLNVPLDWLLGNGPDSLQEYLGEEDKQRKLNEIYSRLPSSLRDVALRQIAALELEEAAERGPDPSVKAD